MKRNTKGFTLIELLAVIVVLAIIALIATPIVLNLIDDAREGAAESTTTGYMQAVENAVLKSMLDSTENDIDLPVCKIYTIDSGSKTISSTESDCVKTLTVDVDDKTLPKAGGTIEFNDNGSIKVANVEVGKFTIKYENGKSSSQAKS